MRDDTRTYHSRASTKHRYLTVAVPKVGCTTMKRALHAFEGLAPADPWWAVHDAGESLRLSAYSNADVETMLTSPDYLRFAFVRNPYERLLSAWKSKVLRPADTQYASLRAEMRVAYGYPADGEDSPVVAFGDFARFVIATAHPDGHWARQTEVLACDEIAYDVLGRFETFDDDFRDILERLDAPPEVVALAHEVTNPTEYLPPAAAYDTELAALVYDYYRDDFERFGYERDSWHTPRITAT
jgi:hypothetical protein